jgi:MFS family permease
MRPHSINFLASGSLLAAWVFIPIYAKEVLGLRDIHIGIMVFTYSLMLFASSYLAGRFSDIYGRRKVLFIGLFASGVVMGLQAVAWNFVTLLIIRSLVGLCVGLFPATLLAYAHEGNSKMGRFTSWGSLGWGVGTYMAGAIVVLTEVRAVFIFCGALCFFGFGLALLLPKRKFESQKVPLIPWELLMKNFHYYFPYFIRHLVACAIWTFWPLILLEIGADPVVIGFIMFINALSQFIVMYFLSDKIDPDRLFIAGLIVSVLTFFSIYIAFIYKNIWFMLLTQILLGVSWSCLYAGTVRYLLDNNKEKASATGLMSSTISTSAVFGPLLATGIIILGGGYSTILLIAVVGAAVSIGLFLLIKFLKKQSHASPS